MRCEEARKLQVVADDIDVIMSEYCVQQTSAHAGRGLQRTALGVRMCVVVVAHFKDSVVFFLNMVVKA